MPIVYNNTGENHTIDLDVNTLFIPLSVSSYLSVYTITDDDAATGYCAFCERLVG